MHRKLIFHKYISTGKKYILFSYKFFSTKCSRLSSFTFKLSNVSRWSHIWLNSSFDSKRAYCLFQGFKKQPACCAKDLIPVNRPEYSSIQKAWLEYCFT